MKIYKKSKEIFLIISILTLIIAVSCLHYKYFSFGNFMLGLFASSFIVYIQSFINYKIELSRILIPFLKEINKSLFEISFITNESLEDTIMNFPSNYYEIKENFEKLNSAIFTINDMKSLDKKSRNYFSIINTEIINLEKKVCLIFKYFEDSTKEEKRYLFIHLYKTLKEFNFEHIRYINFKLADRVDYKEYLSRSTAEKSNRIFDEIERNESKKVYIKFIKEQNKIEYHALKSDFDLFEENEDLK